MRRGGEEKEKGGEEGKGRSSLFHCLVLFPFLVLLPLLSYSETSDINHNTKKPQETPTVSYSKTATQ
jgi:hypothetical protein